MPFRQLMFAVALSASLAASGSQAQGNPHDEAARLISALELSNSQRNTLRDFVVTEMARGSTPGSAVQPLGLGNGFFRVPGEARWIAIRKPRKALRDDALQPHGAGVGAPGTGASVPH
jgi:hypothetical protein